MGFSLVASVLAAVVRGVSVSIVLELVVIELNALALTLPFPLGSAARLTVMLPIKIAGFSFSRGELLSSLRENRDFFSLGSLRCSTRSDRLTCLLELSMLFGSGDGDDGLSDASLCRAGGLADLPRDPFRLRFRRSIRERTYPLFDLADLPPVLPDSG